MLYAKTSLRKEKRDLREKMRGLGDAGPAVAEAMGQAIGICRACVRVRAGTGDSY
jgi:ribosomal protein S14